jgi:hypothetical protein
MSGHKWIARPINLDSRIVISRCSRIAYSRLMLESTRLPLRWPHFIPWRSPLCTCRSTNTPLSACQGPLSTLPIRVACCSWTLHSKCKGQATTLAPSHALNPHPNIHTASRPSTVFHCNTTSRLHGRKWT